MSEKNEQSPRPPWLKPDPKLQGEAQKGAGSSVPKVTKEQPPFDKKQQETHKD